MQSSALATGKFPTTRVEEPGKLIHMSGRAMSPGEQEIVRNRLAAIVLEHQGNQVEAAQAISRRIGVSIAQQTISSILRGSSIGRDIAGRVAKYYGIPLEQMLAQAMLPSGLKEAIESRRSNSWSGWTINTARANADMMRHGRKWTAEQWAEQLDRIETSLAPIAADVAGSEGSKRRR